MPAPVMIIKKLEVRYDQSRTAGSSLLRRAKEFICNSCKGTKESMQLQTYGVSKAVAKLASGGQCLQ